MLGFNTVFLFTGYQPCGSTKYIFFEMEEGLLLDCNLNNSNNNQSEIEDDRQGELGEYQREDSAEKERVEEVQQELNITIEDRNELAEEKGEEATEYLNRLQMKEIMQETKMMMMIMTEWNRKVKEQMM